MGITVRYGCSLRSGHTSVQVSCLSCAALLAALCAYMLYEYLGNGKTRVAHSRAATSTMTSMESLARFRLHAPRDSTCAARQ